MQRIHRNWSPAIRSGSAGKFTGLLLVALLLVAPPLSAQGPPISPSGVRQIEALMAEKASRTPAQRKIDSQILYTLKRQREDALFQAVPQLRTAVDVDRDGRTLVDIRATVSEPLLVYIEELGGKVIGAYPDYDSIRANFPLEQVETLAAARAVRSIRQAERFILNKTNTSEGDVAHSTNTARTQFPAADGTGVKVGVLSDSVDELAALQASGDLPAGVTVLAGQSGVPGSSEGTAMLEIVYDLAPGADLFFATAVGGQAQFATNITDLAAAGAEVIVDDIFYFAEAAFQDGIVAQAVDSFTAGGGLYFSSAGNAGNLNDGTSGTWEGDFSSAPPPPAMAGATDCFGQPCDTADFSGGSSLNTITDDSPSLFTLRWSDPLGGSGNDYDLYLLNSAGTTIFAAGTNVQNGDDDPFEAIDSSGFNDLGNTLAINRYSGAGRCLHLSANRGELSIATDGQTTGHSTAADAFGTAAVDVATAGGGVFTGGAANPVEAFSSDGPRRIILDAAGAPITTGDFSCSGGVERQQPAIAAADGVMTATTGFNPFFGTSAAAPHAAAVAALMQSVGDLNPSGALDLFMGTALDIEAAGVDRDSGWGLLAGLPAVGAVSPAGSCNCGPAAQACPDDLVFDGKPNNPAAAGTINQNARACDTMTLGGGDFSNFSGAADTLIFADGFESGDVSAWSSSVP